MYDAREKSMGQSGLLFGVLTIAVISIAFFGILLMPSKSAPGKIASSGTTSSGEQLLAVLDDRSTRKYIIALNRVSPRATKNLDEAANAAIATGASKDELVQLVMESLEAELPNNMRYLAKFDVKHLDTLLSLSESGLRSLSGANSKWCKGAHYESFAGISEQAMERIVMKEFGYGSPIYDWSMQFNAAFLEAIADSKTNPSQHGKPTPSDEIALQTLAMKMVSNPQVMQLATMRGQDQASMQRVMRNLNVCHLALTGIDAIQSLPKETRGRLWAEGVREMNNNGGLEKAISQMGGF